MKTNIIHLYSYIRIKSVFNNEILMVQMAYLYFFSIYITGKYAKYSLTCFKLNSKCISELLLPIYRILSWQLNQHMTGISENREINYENRILDANKKKLYHLFHFFFLNVRHAIQPKGRRLIIVIPKIMNDFFISVACGYLQVMCVLV